MVRFCLPQDLPASVFSTRARGRLKWRGPGRCVCAPVIRLDIMGWTSWMGWTVDALWAAARVSWGSPHIWPDRRRSRFRGSAFHRRCCLPAYQMWVLTLRRNALSGLQNGRRGPSTRFSGERRGGGRDCRKPGEIADLTLSSGRGPGSGGRGSVGSATGSLVVGSEDSISEWAE